MATDLIERRCGGKNATISGRRDWVSSRAYECRVLVCPEPEGGFSVHALRLPGVVSQGETVDEALANIADAFAAVVESCLESNDAIPWGDVAIDRPKGALERWILVNV